MEFKLHTEQSAPEKSKEYMKKAEKEFGFTPNIIRVMSESPETVKSYMNLSEYFTNSSLSPEEQHVVLMTTSYQNACEYCMSAHSAGAKQTDLSDKDVEALRNGEPLENDKLETLRHFTRSLVEKQGHARSESWEAFEKAGYNQKNALDVMIGVTMKTLSNYTNHMADTPLDEELAQTRWKHPATGSAAHRE